MKRLPLFIAAAFLFFSACKRNPIDRLIDPSSSGAVGTVSGTYVVFDEELKTGGGLGFIPGGQNQSITLTAVDGSRGRHIRYHWNGQSVSSTTTPQHLFAGFELLVTPDFIDFDAATGKNLAFGGYMNLVFSIRADLSDNTTVRVEGPDDGPGGISPVGSNVLPITSSWQEFSIAIPPSHFNDVKGFIIVSLQYAQPSGTTSAGGGGTVYIDDIRYEQ